MKPATTLSHDAVADHFVDLAIEDRRIRAVWVEAPSLERLRRPYEELELHLAADEPDFPALVADIEALVARAFDVEVRSVTDTRRFARQFDLLVKDRSSTPASQLSFTLIVEQTCLLAKRPRAYVVSLADKTNHLTHVMDFSGRR